MGPGMPCTNATECENVNCGLEVAVCAQSQCTCPVDEECVNATDGVPCFCQNAANTGPSGTCFEDECLGQFGSYMNCDMGCGTLFGLIGEVSVIKGLCDCKPECGVQPPTFGMLLECQNSLMPMAANPSVCPSQCQYEWCEPVGNTGLFQVSCKTTSPP